jgi:hypothetical protein
MPTETMSWENLTKLCLKILIQINNSKITRVNNHLEKNRSSLVRKDQNWKF